MLILIISKVFVLNCRSFEDDLFEESKTKILLISLPNKYENLVMTMLHGMKMSSLDEAIFTLIEFDQRRYAFDGDHGQGLFV